MYDVTYIGLRMKKENTFRETRPYCCVTWTRYDPPYAVSYEVGIIFNFLTYKIKILPALGNHFKLKWDDVYKITSAIAFYRITHNSYSLCSSLCWDGGGVTTVKTKYGMHLQRVHHHIGMEITAV